MRITLITVGKIKEKYFTDAIAEYQKRLSRYCKLEILEVADEKTPDGASKRQCLYDRSGDRRKADDIRKFCRKDPGSWYPWGEPYLLSDRRITWHVGQSPSPGRRTHQFFENDISPPTDACDPSGTDLSRFPNHPSRTIS